MLQWNKKSHPKVAFLRISLRNQPWRRRMRARPNMASRDDSAMMPHSDMVGTADVTGAGGVAMETATGELLAVLRDVSVTTEVTQVSKTPLLPVPTVWQPELWVEVPALPATTTAANRSAVV
jgi:hypothetical protein